MVSVLVSRPRFALAVRALFHRIVCDGVEMGFLPLRDNRAARHMIYAHNEAATVTEAIDRKPRARRSGLGVARVCCISGLWTRAPRLAERIRLRHEIGRSGLGHAVNRRAEHGAPIVVIVRKV